MLDQRERSTWLWGKWLLIDHESAYIRTVGRYINIQQLIRSDADVRSEETMFKIKESIKYDAFSRGVKDNSTKIKPVCQICPNNNVKKYTIGKGLSSDEFRLMND